MRVLREIVALLGQIYGELNRIRLILSENSKVGKKISEFDRTHNFYVPFIEDDLNREKYKKGGK